MGESRRDGGEQQGWGHRQLLGRLPKPLFPQQAPLRPPSRAAVFQRPAPLRTAPQATLEQPRPRRPLRPPAPRSSAASCLSLLRNRPAGEHFHHRTIWRHRSGVWLCTGIAARPDRKYSGGGNVRVREGCRERGRVRGRGAVRAGRVGCRTQRLGRAAGMRPPGQAVSSAQRPNLLGRLPRPQLFRLLAPLRTAPLGPVEQRRPRTRRRLRRASG